MSVLDVLDNISLQALATAVALALSVFTFARQELGKRAADLTVTCEQVPGAKSTSSTYVVIHNSGHAVARGVDVTFLDAESGEPVVRHMAVRGTPVDIPPGHSARLDYIRTIGAHSRSLRVEWRDRRRRRRPHVLVAPVNLVVMPGAPVVNVEVRTDGRR
jgi:hypothetical protein